MRLFMLLLCLASPAFAVGVGERAPDFEAPALASQQQPVRLADHAGRVVLVDFWASWCAPCRQSLPFLAQLRAVLGARGFAVIAVNVDEEPRSAQKFLERYPVSYPVAADHAGRIAEQFDVKAMPSSYLVDRHGVVRSVHRGFNVRDGAALRTEVEALLEEP